MWRLARCVRRRRRTSGTRACSSGWRRDRAAPSSSPSTTGSASAAPGSTRRSTDVIYDAVVVGAGLACLIRARAPGASAVPGSRSAPRSSPGPRARSTGRATSKATPPRPIPRPPTSATWPSTRWPASGSACWSAPAPSELDWRLWMDGAIAALGTAALGAAFIFDFVADRPPARRRSRDHPRLPARRHRPARAGRRRHRPHPLAPGRTWSPAARRPRGDGRRRRRLHPADRPTQACPAATGSNRST